MHVVADEEPEYVPPAQIEHSEEELVEYLPAAHTPVTAVSPVVAQ